MFLKKFSIASRNFSFVEEYSESITFFRINLHIRSNKLTEQSYDS